VLVPRPRINLILHYGVLGAREGWRQQVVPAQPQIESASACAEALPGSEAAASAVAPRRGSAWAELMKRTFGFDVMACPGCGGRLRLVALIDEGVVSRRILQHLGVPAEVCPGRGRRARRRSSERPGPPGPIATASS
jgi:hypothetical protein